MQVQAALTALVVYGICFLVCGLFVLIVIAIYHPFKKPLPTGTQTESAEQLLAMARDARRFANRSGDQGNLFWALIFIMEKLCAYGKAKELYAQAAHSGNADAMEHYARHWLIMNAKDPARYWLQKCVDTRNASQGAVKNLRRMKWGRKAAPKYIK